MANNETKNETGLATEIEALLTPATLKEIAKKGEDGQFIQLVDLDHTKDLLGKLAEKYKDLKITQENYKSEGTEAERELRQSRYALQRIHKSNNSFLNEVKRDEKATYEGLIEIIQPEEQRIYDEVNAFKEIAKKKKEEAERKEKERIEGIEKALKEAEFAFEKALIQGKTQEDLDKYNEFLQDFAERFEDFEELEFQAKRLHAVYTAKRTQLVNQIAEQDRIKKEREEAEAKAKAEQEELDRRKAEQEAEDAKRAEQKAKIFEKRKASLIKKGFEFDGVVFFADKIETPKESLNRDEVEWYDFVEGIDDVLSKCRAEAEAEAKAEQERKEQAEKEALLKARNDWQDLVTIYEGLGGDPKPWRLKKDEIPSNGDIEKLTKATRELQKKQKALKLEAVKKDLLPYKKDAVMMLNTLEGDLKSVSFEHVESVMILSNFKNRLSEIITDSFGEVVVNK